MSAAARIAGVAQLVEQRGAVYGHPSDDFCRVARLKAVVAECDDPTLRHVLEMIAVKMSRLITRPDHLDSWADIAGYAVTAGMVIDRRADGARGEAPDKHG